MGDVIIIGAGAAGLSAAKTLSAAGISVCVIEARNRPGGRIHTIRSASGAPIELGAEFVHGRKNEVWDVIKLAQLPTVKVASRRWQVSKGELVENIGFWEHLSRIGATLRPSSQDQSVLGRLDVETGLDAQSRRRMIEFVEGFHAAPIHRMSLKALARANAASERDEGEHSFRVRDGYRGIIEYLMRTISDRAVPVHFQSVVKSVRWEPGAVEVRAETPSGEQMFQSEMALITVPLGVLQNAESGMVFKPEPPGKRDAIDALGMGHVTRLSLEFRERFWPEEDFGFVHGGPGPLPTWWTDSRGLILTGWAGGPRAEALNREQPEAWPETAFASLSSIFHVDSARIRELIVACHCQNWSRDPFALGAYSYTPVGQVEAPNRLAEPVANTLFYAGEATDARGEQGTVHAALASGERAAREILASTKGKRSRMNPRAHEQV